MRETPNPVPNRGMITLSIMLANIIQGVDNTMLNVALPHIQGSLSASLHRSPGRPQTGQSVVSGALVGFGRKSSTSVARCHS